LVVEVRTYSLDETLKELARVCKEHSVRPKLFFEDYDRLRKGHVHPSKFITALDNLKINLSKDKIDLLLNKYRIDDLKVDYVKLCNELSENYLDEKLEKNPNNINELGINLANLTLKNIELSENEENTL